MAISKKISELDVLTSPQDLTKLFPPLFAQDGSPLNIRMSMAEVLKSARQVTITDATVGTSTSILSIAPTWTTNGTYAAPLLVNVTDSGTANAASKLLDLKINNTTVAQITKGGFFLNNSDRGFIPESGSITFINSDQAFVIRNVTDGYNDMLRLTSAGMYLGPSQDILLTRDAADRLALRRSTNAQRFAVYRTFTASDNFERGVMSWYDSSTNDGVAGTVLRIGTEKGTVGGTARAVSIVTDGVERISVQSGGAVSLSSEAFASVSFQAPYFISTTSGGGVFLRSDATNGIRLGASDDVGITRPAAGILGITNGSTGPGTLAIDNVQGTNFERLKMEWDTNVARIGTSKGGSGTARDFAIITDNAVRVTFAAAGGQTAADGHNMAFGTSTGTKIGTATGQKIGFWNATPVVQQVLATGAGATVDNVITLLQTLGLCKQS